MIQQSTEIVELYGDLRGRVLYHVTSVFDFVNGTLVNTGEQVYSGTVAGSAPVMIHDDPFRFDVNLVTGEETGKVFLLNHIAGPKVRCTLDGVGTGHEQRREPDVYLHRHVYVSRRLARGGAPVPNPCRSPPRQYRSVPAHNIRVGRTV